MSRLQSVTVRTIEDYAGRRAAKGDAPATINRDLRHVRTFLNWAKRRQYIREVPSFRRAFVREDEPSPVVMPREHFDAIVAAVGRVRLTVVKTPMWWRTFLHVAYGLGCRRGEILGLRWSQVDLDAGELTVRRETSKGRKDRTLPLVGDVLQVAHREYAGLQRPRAAMAWVYVVAARQLASDREGR